MPTANGNVRVQRTVLPEDALAATDQTVAAMMQVAEGDYGMRSPKIRALAINIVRKAGVKEKDYYGEILAIHEWVKNNIRYTRDPVNQETLSHPEELAFNTRAGDCDDMTILEIALLGSIGIRAWPIVIGVQPGVPSHVYLQAKVPPGKHRKAGKVISLDPIMKEWKAGREAPAHQVKIRHEYRDGDYQNGIQRHREGASNMSGNHDLGDAYDMLPGIGAYATAPSYLDTEDSRAQELLRPDLSVTTGSVANSAKVGVTLEGLDGMFAGMGETVDVGVQTPMEDRDSLYQLGPKGSMTARSAQNDTQLMRSVEPQRISGKKYEAPSVAQALAASRGKGTAQVQRDNRIVTVRTDEGMWGKMPKTAREEANEIHGLAGVVQHMQHSFMPGIGALGEEEKKEAAEESAIATWWATFKARAAAARAAWQEERARQARLQKLPAVEYAAKCEAMLERKNAAEAEKLAMAAGAITQEMARQDPEVARSVAETYIALEEEKGEAANIDGLLGLGSEELAAGKSNLRRGRRRRFGGRGAMGRRARPQIVEDNENNELGLEEREQIQRANQQRIMGQKMSQMRQAAGRGRGRARRRMAASRGQERIHAPINARNYNDPSTRGQQRGFMAWLQQLFGGQERSPAPVHVEQMPRGARRSRRRFGGRRGAPQQAAPVVEKEVAAEELRPESMPPAPVDGLRGLHGNNPFTNPLLLGAAGLSLFLFMNRKK